MSDEDPRYVYGWGRTKHVPDDDRSLAGWGEFGICGAPGGHAPEPQRPVCKWCAKMAPKRVVPA